MYTEIKKYCQQSNITCFIYIFQLEIVEGGLHVKLELKAVKEQFVKLLKNFDDFEQNKTPGGKATTPGVPSSPSKALSSARARVKALYEARKNRINARRTQVAADAGLPARTPSNRHWRRSVDDNKENEVPESPLYPSHRHHYVKKEQKTTRAQNGRHHNVPYRQRLNPDRVTCTGQRLTPIREERGLKRLIQGCASPCISKMVGSTFCESDGEYVTLKNTPAFHHPRSGLNSPRSPSAGSKLNCSADTTVWNVEDDLQNRSADNTAELSSNDYDSTPERVHNNTVQFAKSDLIGELYTSPTYKASLRDVSNITNMSRGSMRQQTSGANLSAVMSNTFNYPLQSTFNYPLHSTMNQPDDFDITRISDGDHSDHDSDTARTPTKQWNGNSKNTKFHYNRDNARVLESIHALSHYPETPLPPKPLPRPPKTYNALKPKHPSPQRNDNPIYINKNTSSHFLQQTTNIPPMKSAHRVTDEPETQEMCGCGLHPAYIQCSYNDADSNSTDDSVEPVMPSHLVRSEGTRTRGEGRSAEKPRRQRRRSRNTVTDTDCDSSYLSECVENEPSDRHQSDDIVYDQAKGCMKLLRRQTANTNLSGNEEFRYPQPLSESDFLFDVTQKHMSLEATRSSMPDISGLAGFITTDDGGDMTDSTLHASRMNDSTDDLLSPSRYVMALRSKTPCDRIPDQRPSSLANSATTTSTSNDSPGSSSGNGCRPAMEVPVNSPNITDSGSSRPTTDTYDYVYVPVSRLSKDALLEHQQQFTGHIKHNSPHRGTHRRRRHTPSKHTAPYASSSTSRSTREHTSRCSSRYYLEDDSGFSTPCSLSKRTSRRSMDPYLESRSQGHFTFSGNDGNPRTVVRHSAVGRNLEPHRKRVLKKKLKQFNNLYHSTGNVNAHSIEVLGDF